MKALSAGVVMLIAALVLIWCALAFLQGYTEDCESSLTAAHESFLSGDRAAALEDIRALKERSDGARDVLCMMIDHSEVTQIEMSMLRLIELCESDDDKSFEAELGMLLARVKNLYESERLCWSNVL